MKEKLRRTSSILLSAPLSIWFNLRYLPLRQAVRLPIWLACNVRVRNMHRGGIVLNDAKVRPGLVRIGFHKTEAIDIYSRHTIINVNSQGSITFADDVHIGHGAIINAVGGSIVCGKNFAISGSTTLICHDNISFGDDVQLAWNSLIMDSDSHYIFDENGNKLPNTKAISIGNKVWMAANVTVLKGSVIPDNCVVGINSLITRQFAEPGCLIAGSPAKVIKKISHWHL